MSTLKVTQVKSRNGSRPAQLDTLRSLGLRRIGHTVDVNDTPQARGMIHAVRHLVSVEEEAVSAGRRTKTSRPRSIGLHNLKPAPGSRRPRKRVGRGHGSGHGKTSGRGHKGAGSRSGAKDRARLRGRPDADPHADAQAARPAHEEVDAVRAVPHAHAGR